MRLRGCDGVQDVRVAVHREALTCCDENESGAGVGDTGGQRKDGLSVGRAEGDRLVDADERARRCRGSDGAVDRQVSAVDIHRGRQGSHTQS